MRGRRFHSLALLVAMGCVAAGVGACSSSSTSSAGTTVNSSGGQGPELTHITVDALEIPDAITLKIAQMDGFFKQQGLTVTIQTIAASDDTTPELLAHTIGIMSQNYVGMFEQQLNTPALQMRVIADDLQAAPGVFALMVPKNSPITSVRQLKDKTIAFPGLGQSIGTLSTAVLLNAYHLPANAYITKPIPFPNMPGAVARDEVDAAWMTEPFITISEAAGARELADVMTGPMNDFPISCWATTEWFIQHYPRTVAAFQRAIVKAQEVAATDQPLVRKLLPGYITGLQPAIANVMGLGTFNTTLSLTRMERVGDVMKEYGMLPASFNVASMYYPLPAGA
jgi:NitT/TauT family transport system substrate-binding protein